MYYLVYRYLVFISMFPVILGMPLHLQMICRVLLFGSRLLGILAMQGGDSIFGFWTDFSSQIEYLFFPIQ